MDHSSRDLLTVSLMNIGDKELNSVVCAAYKMGCDQTGAKYQKRIEKLEAALRFIAGPSTVEFVDGTYEISRTKMLSTYRRRAKRALEGNYDD